MNKLLQQVWLKNLISRWRLFQYPPPQTLTALTVRFTGNGTLGESINLVRLERVGEVYEVKKVISVGPPYQENLASHILDDSFFAINILDTPGLVAGYFDATKEKNASPLEFLLPGANASEFAVEIAPSKDQLLVAAIRQKSLAERVDQLSSICGRTIDAVSFGSVRAINLSNSLADGIYAIEDLYFTVSQNETTVSDHIGNSERVSTEVELDGFQVPIVTLPAIALALANEQADFGAASQVVEQVTQKRNSIAVRRTLIVGLGSAAILFLCSFLLKGFVGKRIGRLEQLAFRQNQRLTELQEVSKERDQRNSALFRLGAKDESYVPYYLSQFLSLAPEGVVLTEATGQPPENGKRSNPDQLTFQKGVYLLKGKTKDIANYLAYREALEGNPGVDYLKDLTYTQTKDGGVTFVFEVFVNE